MVQYGVMSMETRRFVRTDSPGRPPRLTQLLNYEVVLIAVVVLVAANSQSGGAYGTPLFFHTPTTQNHLLSVIDGQITRLASTFEKTQGRNVLFEGCRNCKR